jgi:hypothetical protein
MAAVADMRSASFSSTTAIFLTSPLGLAAAQDPVGQEVMVLVPRAVDIYQESCSTHVLRCRQAGAYLLSTLVDPVL